MFKDEQPLNCYTELTSVKDCIKCSEDIKSTCPCTFKILLDILKDKGVDK